VAERVDRGEIPVAEPWLLRPLWRFEDESASAAARGSSSDDDQDDEEQEDTARRRAPVADGPPAAGAGAGAGVPKAVGANPWPPPSPVTPGANTYLAILSMDRPASAGDEDQEIVTIALELDPAGRSLWGQAALQVRPIHLRGHGYPLIGVRLVASYLGRMSLIDGVIDVGSEDAGELFASLSRRFRVQLVLRGGDGTSVIRREVSARDLERNAALCLESARAALARREYPRE